MPIEVDEEEFDLYGDSDEEEGLPFHVADVVEYLRETLAPDMAERFIRNRFGQEPPDDPDQLEMVIEELIADAYNAGYEDWDEFPY